MDACDRDDDGMEYGQSGIDALVEMLDCDTKGTDQK